MLIKRIILNGFKPFLVPGIENFDYEIKEYMQIVLGTNGCGKSKLFSRLTPMPPDPKLFKPNGLEKKYIEHDNVNYILSMVMDEKGKARHSFYNETDDTELNDGGTVTVQKELASTVFGYSDKIHDILTGKIKFTGLTNAARKEFLFQASEIDLSYAVKVFDAAYRDLRDTMGAYKHIHSRVEDLKLKILSDNERDSLANQIVSIGHSIDKTKAFIASKDYDTDTADLSALGTEVNSILSEMKNVTDELYKDDMYSLHAHSKANTIAQTRHAAACGKKSKLQSDAKAIFNITSVIDSLPDEDKQGNVDVRIGFLKQELSEMKSTINKDYLNKGLDANEIRLLRGTLNKLKHDLDLPFELMPRGELSYTSGVIQSYMRSTADIKAELTQKTTLHRELMYIAENNVECGKCGHVHVHDERATSDNIKRLENEITELRVKVDEHEKNIESGNIAKLKEEFSKTDTIGREIFMHVDVAGASSELIELLFKDIKSPVYYIAKNIDYLIALLGSAYETLVKVPEMTSLEDKISVLEEYVSFKNMGIEEQHRKIEDDIFNVTEEIEKLQKVMAYTERSMMLMEKVSDNNDKIIELELLYDKAIKSQIDNSLLSEASKTLTELTMKQSALGNTLFNAKHVHGVLEESKEELFKLDEDRKALKDLVDALSPTTGIIGNALRELLESFTEDVNEYIGMIWGYDMEVLPYSNKDKLDFRIPLKVMGETMKDISEGSLGQMDVVNFAITLCLMDYLKLDDHPAFMDEVGSTFDPVHSENLITFTNQLVTTRKVSQLFMISHHIAQYGGHVNADYVVLDAGNAILPEVYNENVEIG